MEDGKKLAAQILSGLHFQVDEIDVGNDRTADLRVTDADSIYHVEVKDKLESPQVATTRASILNRGELYEQSDPLWYNNRISGILRDAREQLNQTPKADGTFQLIWFHANGIDADAKREQAFATFYGPVHLIGKYPRSSEYAQCLYFDFNVAFEMPDIDALILTDAKHLQMCLNEFSCRSKDFRSTHLCRAFHALNGVFDPLEWGAVGKNIALRETIPRGNDEDTAKALQRQTGILYSPVRLTRHTVAATVK